MSANARTDIRELRVVFVEVFGELERQIASYDGEWCSKTVGWKDAPVRSYLPPRIGEIEKETEP